MKEREREWKRVRRIFYIDKQIERYKHLEIDRWIERERESGTESEENFLYR